MRVEWDVLVGWSKILVSAPVPLELIGIWVGLGWGWAGFGDGLDNIPEQMKYSQYLSELMQIMHFMSLNFNLHLESLN